MKAEDKDLLLKDLCARLPYDVKCQFEDRFLLVDGEANPYYDYVLSERDIELFRRHKGFHIKPYLRPMLSMTEEEYYGEYQRKVLIMRDADEALHWLETVDSIDWLNAHHFDYRGLIEKGLALEAPKDMYKI